MHWNEPQYPMCFGSPKNQTVIKIRYLQHLPDINYQYQMSKVHSTQTLGFERKPIVIPVNFPYENKFHC